MNFIWNLRHDYSHLNYYYFQNHYFHYLHHRFHCYCYHYRRRFVDYSPRRRPLLHHRYYDHPRLNSFYH